MHNTASNIDCMSAPALAVLCLYEDPRGDGKGISTRVWREIEAYLPSTKVTAACSWIEKKEEANRNKYTLN